MFYKQNNRRHMINVVIHILRHYLYSLQGPRRKSLPRKSVPVQSEPCIISGSQGVLCIKYTSLWVCSNITTGYFPNQPLPLSSSFVNTPSPPPPLLHQYCYHLIYLQNLLNELENLREETPPPPKKKISPKLRKFQGRDQRPKCPQFKM